MEKINVARILSESTKEQIEKEVAEFVRGDRHKIFYGQVYIGAKIESSVETIDIIIKTVCEFYKINMSIVLSQTRKQPYCKYRQIILFLARKYTKISLKDIGDQVGSVDHATVIHAIKTISGYMTHDKRLVNQISDIEEELYFKD